jgi:tetratricopeptide (TPR) repeat protein
LLLYRSGSCRSQERKKVEFATAVDFDRSEGYDMGFFDDVKLTLLLARRYDDRMSEKSLRLPSVRQTADELIGGINTTLVRARKSTDIGVRKLHLASTRTEIRQLKRLAPRCRELQRVDLDEVELQLLQIEKETEVLEQQAIAKRIQNGQELEKRGLIREAIAAYEKLVSKMVDTPFTYRRLAILYRKLKSYDDEIRVLRAALKNVPRSNRNHYDWFKARLLKIEKLEQCHT